MRTLLIVNPVSGREPEASSGEHRREIEQALAGASFEIETRETTPERTAAMLARAAVAEGREVVIVAGGDGTVSEVARELVGTSVRLGIIPAGTFNNFARSLGLLPELEAACRVIVAGHARGVDVGQANGSEYFFEAAGVGIDAELFPIGEEVKSGHWSRIAGAIRLATRYQHQKFEIEFDRPAGEAYHAGGRRRRMRQVKSRRIHKKALFVVVANGPFYGSNFTVAAEARMNDGFLTLSVFRNFSKWELLWHFGGISKGRYRFSPKVETYRAREISIRAHGRPLPFHADGHPLGHTPVKFAILPGALRIFVPAEPMQENGESGAKGEGPRSFAIDPSGLDLQDAESIAAAARAGDVLEESIAEIHTAEEAERVIDALEAAAGLATENEVAARTPALSPEQQTAEIDRAAEAARSSEKPAAAIAEAAKQLAAALPADKPALDEAVARAAGLSPEGPLTPDSAESRRLLRDALIHRLRPLQAADAALFIRINNLTHTPLLDRLMSALSFTMTGGHAWLLVPLAEMLWHPRRGRRSFGRLALPLWLATVTVEHGLKRLFRRRRPFASLVRAIVVGRKPGSFSFPSGHSAAAFAGAVLLSRQYPRARRGFYLLAGLVAFSRVYLGAHYPGDVLTGSVSGALLAKAYRLLLRRRL